MILDREKLKAFVLYIVWRTSHTEGFGSTKLNKVLWFTEARSFEAYGRPITGEQFIRDQFGPRSKHLREICDELEREGRIEPFSEQMLNYPVHRYRALHPADTSMFTAEELTLADWWIATIAERYTATSISQLSHDYGWEVAAMGEELPLHALLAKRIRPPKAGDELEWAEREAERLGLK